MQTKYSNIFWHEGVRIFSDRMLDTSGGQQRIAHLENDVTKALLNLFEHGSPALLKSFLRMLHVKDAPESFSLDFQVTDTTMYRRQPRRIMLAIKATSTPTRSYPGYNVATSRPDACISNDRTAILIEVKTQSPLVIEQLDSHIRHYLGTATETPRLTWEDVSDNFRGLRKSHRIPELDMFLIEHFLGLLEMLGIDRFNGFDRSDFEMLDDVGKIPDDDYRDFKRQFRRKSEKFTAAVFEEVRGAFPFKPLSFRVEKGDSLSAGSWSAIYFHDDDERAHVNRYPNLNLTFSPTGIRFSVNAEIAPTVRKVLECIASDPDEFNRRIAGISDMYVALYYKVQFQPMDHFVWRLLPGFPLPAADVSGLEILDAIEEMKKDWERFLRTALHEMKAGTITHESRRPFTEAEIRFARQKSVRANFVFRLEKQYYTADVDQAKRHIIRTIARDIRGTAELLKFIISHD